MSSQTLLTPSIITKETLMRLENNLVMANKVNRQFENQFVKIGSSLTIRKPNRFVTRTGPTLQVQDINEPSVSITVNKQTGVDFQFTDVDLTLTIEEFSERYLKPAAATLANKVDYDVISNYSAVYNLVGSPGSPPAAFSALAAVGQRLDEEAAPQDGRYLVLDPKAYWSMANGLTTLYVQSVAEPALKGFLANIANFAIFMDQNIQSHTVGALGGTPQVNLAGQTGSTINTKGWSNSITGLLTVGDVVTFDGVYAVNPQSRASTGVLREFVITATANSDGGGLAALQISPAIVTTGAYQNVTASPANNAAVTIKTGTAATAYAQNIGFCKDAFGLVMVPMEIPGGVDFAARETYRNISLRVIRAYDINNDVRPTRLDMLYGTTTYYPEMACRLTN